MSHLRDGEKRERGWEGDKEYHIVDDIVETDRGVGVFNEKALGTGGPFLTKDTSLFRRNIL